MILCQAIIWLTDKSNTYCMRELGHTGKCNTENKEPEIKKEAKKESK